ncbi:putative bifunctional diguanylate cyclase/phosphodiesterase [Albimonas pacifica]|uniref:Diguanylate cyclase/phosphodiesterase n=1 Tax=Albimonas pacifica TaxID=1114924 RepID=A0A1I3BZX1_9RHOB|nr:EAL domain-containing protein [Albimonas pacifica]SFH67834.1 diguanylate cyclase/phosphodiesterase [Albimonas pacifica]
MGLAGRALTLARSAEGMFLLCWAAVYAAATALDVMDEVIATMVAHEDWELDELILALAVAGLLATAALARRGLQLRRTEAGRERAEAEVAWLAQHDPLTGLFNRRFIDEMTARQGAERRAGADRRGPGRPWSTGAERRGEGPALEQGAVLALDLDGFKQVNTLVGHAGGDALLRKSAARLRRAVPGGVIARLGGDEFVVIVDRLVAPDPLALGERICAALSESIDLDGIAVRVGASVGVARLPEDTRSLAEALGMADAALYAAKDGGRGRAVAYRPKMGDALARRAELETGLRRALAEELDEPAAQEARPPDGRPAPRPAISLLYQPLVDLASGRLSGFEALARWTGPDGAPAAQPDEFVALAEQTGQIMRLSEQLLRQACADAARWPEGLRLSFNISPAQLGDPGLARRILDTLAEEGLPPARLQIEVTETAVMRNPDMGAMILDGLREAGVRVALDDFGAGYSSLAQITRLRFDGIKIDRGFIARAGDGGEGDEILRAVLGLALGLGVEATAEGIETEDQLARLRALGCGFGQGFLLGRPAPQAETLARIAAEARALAQTLRAS